MLFWCGYARSASGFGKWSKRQSCHLQPPRTTGEKSTINFWEECTSLQTPQAPEFVLEDSFSFRLQGRDFVIGEPAPLVPQPAKVAKDLALARAVQSEMDKDNLTYREVGPKHGFSRATVGRLVPLVRLAPDIQDVVSRLTTTTASERIDRETLEWVGVTSFIDSWQELPTANAPQRKSQQRSCLVEGIDHGCLRSRRQAVAQLHGCQRHEEVR